MVMILKKENGYGYRDQKEVRDLIDQYLPVGSKDKVTLLDLLYDYECLMRVIEGDNYRFQHPDGSEVRRVKLY